MESSTRREKLAEGLLRRPLRLPGLRDRDRSPAASILQKLFEHALRLFPNRFLSPFPAHHSKSLRITFRNLAKCRPHFLVKLERLRLHAIQGFAPATPRFAPLQPRSRVHVEVQREMRSNARDGPVVQLL